MLSAAAVFVEFKPQAVKNMDDGSLFCVAVLRMLFFVRHGDISQVESSNVSF